ncbi:hypothetical protein EDF58_1011176 [Novosphingobium sp. PhB57]|jgi:hypothetical protein|uniref:hypothetical protein n=1 Tax=unclassified Novosphingobium TaxID=2644732 RepID=UPI0010521988|nr:MULTISPECIES: hypothetical protein [unclassified Novosphingobium]TCU61848.1 hypothetical protein EDF58_1011176 [Novosphingobium sp. PhB57]TDW68916.1 hypothetical protein EDF57_101809 [Novosphingobium sp. PhB55]
MSLLGGTYECSTKTPMGHQKGTLTIVPEGDTFTGQITGDLGTMELRGGTISGNQLSWKMKMTSPMPIDLDCKATVDGTALTGTIKAGFFGTMPLEGTKTS